MPTLLSGFGLTESASNLSPADERIRVRTLSNLRWIGVFGQIATLGVVYFVLGFHLPVGLCLSAIAASIAMNLLMTWDPPWQWRDRDRAIAISLSFDIFQLAALLFLTGGLENPFSVFFLVPASIAAGALPLRWSVPITILTFILISLLAIFHLPLPWKAGEVLKHPPLLIAGVWFALSIALVFATIYASIVARQREDMTDALAATQMVLAREERLSALGGLAAAAAHELGTPLATIQITAREMLEELEDGLLREDAELLVTQSVRCRDILSQISLTQNECDKVHDVMTLASIIEEATAPLADLADKQISVIFEPPETSDRIGELSRRPEILYGLRNLIENALQYADEVVTIKAVYTSAHIEINVLDDGPGFPPEVAIRLGEPYLGTRRNRQKEEYRRQAKTGLDKKGLGLGFFIAKTLLTRTGATLTHGNVNKGPESGPKRGAFVSVRWQIEQLRIRYPAP